MELVDTHCHLATDAFSDDIDEVIARARRAGVTRILVPGTDIESSQQAIQLTERYPEIFAAVGIHPHSAASWQPGMIEVIRQLAQQPKVVAIGEIGLDYYRDFSPKAAQISCFRSQLALAYELGLPVVVHNREAIEDILTFLIPWAEGFIGVSDLNLGVLHAFSADEAAAWKAIDHGFYIGIAGPITYKKAEDLRTLVYNLPINRLLIETDSPYLSPEPTRGKRNEPAHVRWILEKVASVRDQDVETVARVTTRNAETLFNWTDGPTNRNIL